MLFKIAQLAKELKIPPPDLITRPTGKRMYQKMKEKMQHLQDSETIILDFNEIKVLDSSFIDEFIVKLINDAINSKIPYYIKLKNISQITEINIESVFDTYSRYNKKIVVITDDITHNNKFYIGPLRDTKENILNILRRSRGASIPALSEITSEKEEDIRLILEEMFLSRIVRFDKENNSYWHL